MTDARLHAVAASCVFDGTVVHRDAAVVIEGEEIHAVVPRRDVPRGMAVHDVADGAWLAPGFIDVQVNGGGDELFNDEPTPAGITTIIAAHRRFGTTGLLPTLITDTPEKTAAALAAVQALFGREPGLLGIHLEGPFLSPERAGVHDPRYIRAPTKNDLDLLVQPRKGVTLVTLAPEMVPEEFIAQLAAAGIVVSLGHSMARYAQTAAAMAAGLTGFTHLFNAMRPIGSRDPGPIVAALERPDAFFGLIVDGVHVDAAVLRLALRGAGHPMLVTDAMPPVGGRRARFLLYGQEIVVENGRCARRDGTLAGAALDMASAVRNCVTLLNVPLESALRFASAHPAKFIGLGDRLGRLGPGYRADLVAIDPGEIAVRATWVAGVRANVDV